MVEKTNTPMQKYVGNKHHVYENIRVHTSPNCQSLLLNRNEDFGASSAVSDNL